MEIETCAITNVFDARCHDRPPLCVLLLVWSDVFRLKRVALKAGTSPNRIAAASDASAANAATRHPELIVSCQTLPAVARLTKAREPTAAKVNPSRPPMLARTTLSVR